MIRKSKIENRRLYIIILMVLGVLIWVLNSGHMAMAGPYTDSAHGSTSYGVDRDATGFPDYAVGNCAHCHEQHASIGGAEPAPTGGPDKFLLFDENHTSQTVNFCFDCHTDSGSYQMGGLTNRSYTYRAGNYNDGLNDIQEAFSTSNNSYHDLNDIVTFITGQSWGYTADSNPCAACHNPHAVQGDPANSPNTAKTSTTRGYPVTRPSEHGSLVSTDILWGDNSGEKMSDYTGTYQAPYRYTSNYEPDGSGTYDGSNLTDYVTFCQDCHVSNMTGSPYNLSNTPIDWTTTGGESGGDKHGKNIATDTSASGINLRDPYLSAWTSSGLVLACTDCHEPHGAANNLFLVREEINGSPLEYYYDTTSSQDLKYVCNRCHTASTDSQLEDIHHGDSNAPYYGAKSCMKGGGCHGGTKGSPIDCDHCHFHGGDDDWILSTVQSEYHTDRRTF